MEACDAKTVIKNKLACAACENWCKNKRVCIKGYADLPVTPDCKIRKMLRAEKE